MGLEGMIAELGQSVYLIIALRHDGGQDAGGVHEPMSAILAKRITTP